MKLNTSRVPTGTRFDQQKETLPTLCKLQMDTHTLFLPNPVPTIYKTYSQNHQTTKESSQNQNMIHSNYQHRLPANRDLTPTATDPFRHDKHTVYCSYTRPVIPAIPTQTTHPCPRIRNKPELNV